MKPRLGFLGVGWIGRHRLEAIAGSGLADIAVIADPRDEAVAAAAFPGAATGRSLDDVLRAQVDGVVIATPSALHAEQAIAALEQGVAVFCQKPLARHGGEARHVVDAAKAADRLLGLDLSYRHIPGMADIRQAVQAGALGDVFAVDLAFHNAYSPNGAWCRDPKLAGGGCMIDLGVHLVDLALWTLGFPAVDRVSARLYAEGTPLAASRGRVEDYGVARLDLASGATVNLSCSWNFPAGCDAVITAHFYGTRGGAALDNVHGSFYDFSTALLHGNSRQPIAASGAGWGGQAALAWTGALGVARHFDPEAERFVQVAAVLDRIYES